MGGGEFPSSLRGGVDLVSGSRDVPPPSSCIKDECESTQLWNLQVDASLGQR